MSPAPFELLQKAWTSADGPAQRWLALQVVAKAKGLVWQRRVRVGGVSCYLLARQDPAILEKEDIPQSVLFFVHGGGYVAHLFLPDMPVLASWTSGVDTATILVIPEYTLLPEGRYPKPVLELLSVYTSILKVCLAVCVVMMELALDLSDD